MTTIINTPGTGNSDGSDSGVATVLIVIVLLVAAGLFFVYGLPAIRNANNAPKTDSINIDVKLPAGETSPATPPKP